LVYLDWTERNRAYVNAKTGGRVGYMHVPNMGGDGAREFVKWYYPQARKSGLVVDDRANGGGNISQWIIDRLSKKLLGLDYPRNAEDPGTYPDRVMRGPMACLISETSASDGDIFPYMFRLSGLGPLIGKRTWGGVVGISGHGMLIDGGETFVPQYANVSREGKHVVEGEGVSPDIEVDNLPADEMYRQLNYKGEPTFEAIPGTGVEYASNTPNDVLRIHGRYYLCLQGIWFESAAAQGPWEAADKIPDEIYSIPPESSKHNVTYVAIQDSTTDTVTYAYTGGYTGVYIGYGVAMWGTGYYYPPYYGYGSYPLYWPSSYYTYGASAWYNPATGAKGAGKK
jgi:hypothetical protein